MRDPDWRRDLDARRGAPGPAHPTVLAVVQWLIQALRPYKIRRRLYPVQRWALLNHYQHQHGPSRHPAATENGEHRQSGIPGRAYRETRNAASLSDRWGNR